ncbi:hypothetical protein SV7mr_14180 [Stieleria bergensis]|uniref:LarA-like N-terminal domain-containing protein n=1 Tax=Stieleria bergensis TaxID=2528025 RepID=A0A517SS23_9BACT|nr:MAG: hypothetical protein CBB71_16485 [Rhodopirellula sp. TMED11]OUT59145.1 MAG: hypothetical protein CBB71_11550 [Rhodopirellula sp. TMED11]QDT58916.1 hypothetical protein SV7mr_14180 [Planctomycetes bacterium SV_7m_r]
MSLPRFQSVQQQFARRRIDNLQQTLAEQLQHHPAIDAVTAGDQVGIAVGSRGIDRIDQCVSAIVKTIIAQGGEPFVVPAMGSHGGATAEGQIDVLKSLGVSEQSVGCPIRSSMETVHLGDGPHGLSLYFDKHAAAADQLILINRVKPHTRLTGAVQSGLCKMLMIGLGKHRGAIAFHPTFASFDYQLEKITPQLIPNILSQTPVTLGIALVEDAFDQVGHIELIEPQDWLQREPQLLQQAMDWMPRLPFPELDLLIVDQIGKEISGTGMDTNVIGRKWHDKMAGPDEQPRIHEIYVRSLTSKTAGNASGIGIAEYTHRWVAEAYDLQKTRVNCITAGHATAAAMPVWFDNDRDVFQAVMQQSGKPAEQLKWARIKDTLHLDQFSCSEACLIAPREPADPSALSEQVTATFQALDEPRELTFDDQGNLN